LLRKNAVEHFGTQTNLAMALGISAPAVSMWGDFVPEKQALRLERLTAGELVYDEIEYRHQTNQAEHRGKVA
jgi:DNA-binding transcriptional regulator YdaS (Cro superfamily)